MDIEKKIGTLEEEALKRKERLKILKRKAADNNKEVGADGDRKFPKPKFRSYKPHDETLQESVIPDAERPDIEEAVKDQLASAKVKMPMEELDISNLAPRKPDWDLKRDCAKRFEKLEQQTKQAIAELIRDRLKEVMENQELDGDDDLSAVSRMNELQPS